MSFLVPNLRFGPFELDAAAGELRKAGILIKLQPQPFHVLLLLAERAGTVVTRDEIQRCLWSDSTFVDFEHGINFSINQIRGALADNAEKPRYIETLPRRGYRFVARVVSNGEHAESSVTSAEEPEYNRSSADNWVSVALRQQRRGKRGKRWKPAILMLLAAAITLGIAYGARSLIRRDHRPNLEKIHVTKLTDSGKVDLVAISPDGRYVCYSLRDRGGLGLWLHQLATGSDTQVLPANAISFEGLSFSPDGNYIYYVRGNKNDPGFKDLYVMPVLGGPSKLLLKDIDSPAGFSPNGSQFVYTRGMPVASATEVRIANADGSGNHLLATLPNTEPSTQPGATWSPDGRTIAVSLQRSGTEFFILYGVSVSDGSVHELLSNSSGIGRPLWLPEGDTLFVVMNDKNGRGQLWTISYPKAEIRRVTNDLTNYGTRADLTPDAKTMAAVMGQLVANVWEATEGHLDDAKQITWLALPLVGISESPDGRLLAVGQDGRLWSLRADGNQRAPFTEVENVRALTPCGPYVVFAASGTNAINLVRVDSDGANLTPLISGKLASWPLVCTRDGKYVFYMDLRAPHTISRIAVEGGAPVRIAEVLGEDMVGRLSISPDGKFLAYPYEEYTPTPTVKLAIISSQGGPPTKIIAAPGGAYADGSPLWSPDGKSLQYILTDNGASNIWEQPLDGSKPRQLTTFASGHIFDFRWSLDGKRLLLTHGTVSSDVVLLSDLR